jgi:hypothetical protein
VSFRHYHGRGDIWLRKGHCRRCENGLGHTISRNRTKPTGTLLQRDRMTFDDELAPGEKRIQRRRRRARENQEWREREIPRNGENA